MNLADYRGQWALITGGSSGIGREFAFALASHGLNLVLVARRAVELTKVAQQCERVSGVQTRIIATDLSVAGAVTKLKEELSSHDIKPRLLCNNAAFGHWGRFEDVTVSDYERMISLNITATVSLTSLLLEDLLTHPSSIIINVSSQAAYQPVPYMAVYAGSKAFIQSFSQALHGELAGRGVLVQTLVPGPTRSAFDLTTGSPPAVGSHRDHPAKAVQASLNHLSSHKPVVASVSGIYKQRCFAGLAPVSLIIKLVSKMFLPPPAPMQRGEEKHRPRHG